MEATNALLEWVREHLDQAEVPRWVLKQFEEIGNAMLVETEGLKQELKSLYTR
jgi:hypothetical protein